MIDILTKNKIKKWIKSDWEKIISPYLKNKKIEKSKKPITILMAGCTGAGKSEFSRMFLKISNELNINNYVLVDPDEFYKIIRNKFNIKLDCRAELNLFCVNLMEKLISLALNQKFNILIDSSFSNEKSLINVKRSLKRKRIVKIFFILEKPELAWDYVKKREKIEGRKVSFDFFFKTYFGSIKMIKKSLEMFENQIILNIYKKSQTNLKKFSKFELICKNIKSAKKLDKIIKNIRIN